MGEPKSVDLSQAVLGDFTSHVGTHFTCSDPWKCEFELTEASEYETEQDCDSKRKPFSLIFKTPNSIEPHQGIHHLNHDSLGEIDLFLVPVEEADGHYHYEATFN